MISISLPLLLVEDIFTDFFMAILAAFSCLKYLNRLNNCFWLAVSWLQIPPSSDAYNIVLILGCKFDFFWHYKLTLVSVRKISKNLESSGSDGSGKVLEGLGHVFMSLSSIAVVTSILLSWGRGGVVLGVDEKFLFREKIGWTPNDFFQKIGGTP